MRRILPLLVSIVIGTLVFLALDRPKPAPAANPPDPASRRATLYGEVIGTVQRGDQGDVHLWLGIPYAQAPVGDLRWRAPKAPFSWNTPREAVAYGPACAQLGGFATGTKLGTITGSEDCLTVNVYAPRFDAAAVPAGDTRLPVLVWIHGGGNSAGASFTYAMASRLAAQQHVIVVSFNYRLGIFGWFRYADLHHDGESPEDRSGNYGTLDQIQALRWVQWNIGAFGGDSKRVTVFGESAGGVDAFALLASPLAKGLFQGAIIQSGIARTRPVAAGENFVDDRDPGDEGSSADVFLRLLEDEAHDPDVGSAKRALGRMDHDGRRLYLRGKSADELLHVFQGAAWGMYRSPGPFADGVVLPAMPLREAFRDPAHYNAVPVILGTNRDEYRLFAAGHPELVKTWFGAWPHIRDAPRYQRLADYLSLAWKAGGADEPAAALQRPQGPGVFVYRFDWDEEPTFPVNLRTLLGAAHGLEVPFVFGVPELAMFHEVSKENLPGRRELSAAMGSYWAQFAATGNPGRGRKGELPEWGAWSEASASPRMLLLDTAAGGGVRMSDEGVTFAAIKARLAADPALKDDVRERCLTYAQTFWWFEFREAFVADEYAALGCAEHPVAEFRPPVWP